MNDFFKGFFTALIGALIAFYVLFAIDAELCRQERENLQPQNCIFSINCKN